MKKLLLFLLSAIPLYGQCTGSGVSWSCPAGATVSQVQSAINSASNNATITFAAGSYSWTSEIQFSTANGVTLICASAPASSAPWGASTTSPCTINSTTSVVLGLVTFSGTLPNLYRISGFTFVPTGNPQALIWIDSYGNSGVNVMQQLRLDHNTFNVVAGGVAVFTGDVSYITYVYGVMDHNLLESQTGANAQLIQMIGSPDASPAHPTPLGTAYNMFLENNTLSFTSMSNAGEGCVDGWAQNNMVIRYNTSNDCLWTTHGTTHSGGPLNIEFYNNTISVDAGSVAQGFQDCYRCFHHQGSGEFVAFNNIFTAYSGKNGEVISMANYRGYANGPSIDGNAPACDGTVSSVSWEGVTITDGNRSPGGTWYGYPCYRQPGRAPNGNYVPMYAWNNYWSDTLAEIGIVNPDFGGTVPNGSFPPTNCTTTSSGNCDYNSFQMQANREWYNAVSASAQSSSTSPFNGTTGMGFGSLANRPTTCTTSTETAYAQGAAGVGYFATDTNTLYTCSATNTWTAYYTPYTYPHPLVSGDPPPPPPAPPTNLTSTLNTVN